MFEATTFFHCISYVSIVCYVICNICYHGSFSAWLLMYETTTYFYCTCYVSIVCYVLPFPSLWILGHWWTRKLCILCQVDAMLFDHTWFFCRERFKYISFSYGSGFTCLRLQSLFTLIWKAMLSIFTCISANICRLTKLVK